MKNRKKWAFALVVLVMAALFAGCGKDTSAETTTQQPESTWIQTEESVPETTPAPTEPAVREISELKVGMIFLGEENEGSLLAASLQQQMQEAASAIGMTSDQILCQYIGREAEWTQVEDSILACVDQGCQLIIGCAREYEAVIAAIAEEYPQIMFTCVGSEWYNGKNSGTFTIDVSAAQYLCGAAAGLQTDTHRVGFVAAKGSEDVDVTEAVNAFAYGVWSTDPEAVVEVAVIGKWFLPGAEDLGVDTLRDLGCDQLGYYTDRGLGTLQYQWQIFFAQKLQQMIQKDVIGEAWSGDYYLGAVTFDPTVELPEYVWKKLMSWGPVEETDPEETTSEIVPETTMEDTSGQTEIVLEDTSGDLPEGASDDSIEGAAEEYEIPEISIDSDTGYLSNVRVHEIRWDQD